MKKQNIIVVGIIAFILTVAVGYALFSETLTISGTATAEAILDRLVYHSHVIKIKGKSYRLASVNS